MFILGVQNTESKKFKKEKKTGNKREVKKIKIFEDEELEEEEEKIEEENNKENEEEDEDPKLEFSCARLRPFTKQKDYEMIKVEKTGENKRVGLITLNRPKPHNALCNQLMDELADSLQKMDKDQTLGVIIVTGCEKVFATGADIREMAPKEFAHVFGTGFLENWSQVSKVRKPVIAAVNGYALGGGCELAMMCDIIYAGEKAMFGQPEIGIGTIPGAGGTQRLTRIVGKSLAMKMCLTGDPIDAKTALQAGLVAGVFPPDQLVAETIKLADKIASHSQLLLGMAKQSVNRAYESTLEEGLLFERQMFHTTFATNDRKEGMTAFMDKRQPKWQHS
uniref:Probable enoyl-CoA hydratase, mitochondrial n=1 Tax=Meloidogyne floridensis TaxID=298350 RepID=A0A915NI69_9BILA